MKLYALYSKDEAVEVVNELKTLFGKMGFTIELHTHALDRLLGRDKNMTKEQMLDTFKFLLMTKKRDFKPMRDKPEASMIVNDDHNNGNYILNFNNNHIIITTAMKKAGFKSSHDRQNSHVVKLGSHTSRADANAGEREEETAAPEEAPMSAPTNTPTVTSKAPEERIGSSSDKVWPQRKKLTLGRK